LRGAELDRNRVNLVNKANGFDFHAKDIKRDCRGLLLYVQVNVDSSLRRDEFSDQVFNVEYRKMNTSTLSHISSSRKGSKKT
jgi:hypothetical protein